MLPTYVGGKAAEYEIDWTYINNAGWHHYRRPISVDLVALSHHNDTNREAITIHKPTQAQPRPNALNRAHCPKDDRKEQ